MNNLNNEKPKKRSKNWAALIIYGAAKIPIISYGFINIQTPVVLKSG